MERKSTILLVALIAFLLVASILPLNAAAAGLSSHPDQAQQQVYYPQQFRRDTVDRRYVPRQLLQVHVNHGGCRCCLLVGKEPNVRCERACCDNNAGDDCCLAP